jgi:caffeoyl-CoA O-methyltransferase
VSKFTALTDDLHEYIVEHGAREDEALRSIREETAAMGEDLAVMQIAPDQGAFMTLLCKLLGARETLELGTFTGYSAICIARGLAPGGRLIACELSEEYAEVAARNFERAGVADRIEIRIGPAIDTLRALPEREVVDFAFIDADKPGYADYYEECLARLRPGGLIVLDNVLTGGAVLEGADRGHYAEGSVATIRTLNDQIAEDARVDVAMIGVADGLTLARKR